MTDRPGETKTTYIGDGVYASTDGYHIILRTQRETGWHEIFLDDLVWNGLVTYAAGVFHVQQGPPVPDIGPAGFGDNPYLKEPKS